MTEEERAQQEYEREIVDILDVVGESIVSPFILLPIAAEGSVRRLTVYQTRKFPPSTPSPTSRTPYSSPTSAGF